jgi:protein-tyrosine kinase
MSRIDKAIEMAARIKSSDQEPPERKTKKTVLESTGVKTVAPLRVTNPFLVTVNEPHGIVTEEFNKLRALILQLTNSGTRKNALLVTSAVPNEGKTLTAVNLALSIARSTDHTVLLVDADLRRPAVHKMFNIKAEPGLVQCLRDNLPLKKALVKTGLGKLVILPAGQQVDAPLELLSSKQMQRFVLEIKERYPERYVIFDSPPVLPFADARVLGPLMDGTIFVTRENYSRLKQIKEGLDFFHDSQVLGVLCNDTSFSVGSKYGNYYS